MKQVKLPWLLFALALVAIVVPIAQGTSTAKDPRVAGLIKRIASLEKRSTALEKQVTILTGAQGCIGIQPVVHRGNPAAQDGYLYAKSTDPNNLYLYTAYDAPAQGEAPTQLMAIVNPQCVASNKSFFRTNRALTSKSAQYRGSAR
jgi:hypothetical protein